MVEAVGPGRRRRRGSGSTSGSSRRRGSGAGAPRASRPSSGRPTWRRRLPGRARRPRPRRRARHPVHHRAPLPDRQRGGPAAARPGTLQGRTVLVSGGAGAVGNAAIQLARWSDATIITTVSSPQKGQLAAAAGADHVIDYRQTGRRWPRSARSSPAASTWSSRSTRRPTRRSTPRLLAPARPVATYADDGGGAEVAVPVRASMVPNVRWQFVLVYTVPAAAKARAVDDLGAAMLDGAIGVGEAHGLPLHHFGLDQAAAGARGRRAGRRRQGADHALTPRSDALADAPAGRMSAVSEAGDQRWAPFPVQDWSTMPAGPAGGPPAGADPGPARARDAGARPRRRGPGPARGGCPLVVLLCLGLVVGTGTWLARRAPEPRDGRARVRARRRRRPVAAGGQTRETRDARRATQVTESARFAGIDRPDQRRLVPRHPGAAPGLRRNPSDARLWRTDHDLGRRRRRAEPDDPLLPRPRQRRAGGRAGGRTARSPRTSPRWSSCRPTSARARRWTRPGSAGDTAGLHERVPRRGRARTGASTSAASWT